MTSPLARRQVSGTQKVLFHPYSRQQMASILRQQVERLPGPVFEPMALTLCAAKVRQQAKPRVVLSLEHAYTGTVMSRLCGEHDVMLSCVVQMADNHGDVRKALSTCEAALNMLVDDAHSAAAAAGQHRSTRVH